LPRLILTCEIGSHEKNDENLVANSAHVVIDTRTIFLVKIENFRQNRIIAEKMYLGRDYAKAAACKARREKNKEMSVGSWTETTESDDFGIHKRNVEFVSGEIAGMFFFVIFEKKFTN